MAHTLRSQAEEPGLLVGPGEGVRVAQPEDRTLATESFELGVGERAIRTLYTNTDDTPRGWERCMIRSTEWAHTASVEFALLDPGGDLVDGVLGNLQHYPTVFDPPHRIPPGHAIAVGVRNRGGQAHTYRVLTTVGEEPTRALSPALEVGSTVGAAVASSVIASWLLGRLR